LLDVTLMRWLIHGATVATMAIVLAGQPAAAPATTNPLPSAVLARFLSSQDTALVRYRALRHMEARCEHFASDASMDVWTEIDANGAMHYRIVNERGSDYIRSKVFRGVLDAEQKAVNDGTPRRAGLTLENYVFDSRATADGLASAGLKPKRKDLLLVDGSVYFHPNDGELVRIEGRLSKTPSFWIRRVDIVRHYRRFGGISMPVGVESVANLLVAGHSTFKMTYDYESVAGRRVGSPQVNSITALQTPGVLPR
jgi:hypothetical protein